jgi:glycerol transport system ATP-binding protein
MQLTLECISKKVGGEAWLYPMSISPQKGAVTVLLGATQAGKTSLMRIMAGLDAPNTGKVLVDNNDVTGVSVRKRNVAMVYQQFINYPSLTVAQNIASPLRLRGEKNTNERVLELAQKLHIDAFLDRLPAELSGGQQQRVALARALVKDAPLLLLDEPLVNLDYKLREGLREELTHLFSAGDSTVVYATTEPGEALLLGGYTAVLDQGELLQYGPVSEVFQNPKSIRVARAFSDPPMNFITATLVSHGVRLASGPVLPVLMSNIDAADGAPITIGIRASALRLQAREGDAHISGRVQLGEISGSDTFIHTSSEIGELVAQVAGVHHFELGSTLVLHFSPSAVFVFGQGGELLWAPEPARKH